jgi:thiol:disulfide interchange protein
MPPPGQGWQRGAMAYQMAMGLRHRNRVPVLLFFWRPGCSYSRALEAQYFNDPRFLRGTAGIIMVKVNTTGSAADRALAKRLRVPGTPTVLVYPGRGGRPREVIVFFYSGNRVARKTMAQVIAEVRRQAFGR